ncbi:MULTISPECIES: MBL fold metallo-hydrolase [unclassified Variovorax]|uniref:MBL fold metallo-hydrolase n=1 Tax=unclassified Variovorax TaxID=663243 RepID=UPI001BD1D273|nr:MULTISPECIES: MBL fold metallo-hydrolase [unclassified Variovorax]
MKKQFIVACTAALVAVLAGGLAQAQPAASQSVAQEAAREAAQRPARSRPRTNLVLLGTAGGRTSWNGTPLAGIASALEVDGDVYLVDFGEGWARRYFQARLGARFGNQGMAALRAAFITHMHADHVIGYPSLFTFGMTDGLANRKVPMKVFGPGRRGAPIPIPGPDQTAAGTLVAPGNPNPGTVDMTELVIQTFASDINTGMREGRKPDPHSLVQAFDIRLPDGLAVDPNAETAPSMEPVLVYEDEKVRVTAVLVSHAPEFLCFAYRFDTADGAVVFSGDTGPDKNLVRLARGADVLVHEVIDTAWIDSFLPKPRNAGAEAVARHLVHSHTAAEDVGGVAQAAGVKTLVLNHFGPADASPQRWARAQDGFTGRLIVGNDLMRIGVGAPIDGRLP